MLSHGHRRSAHSDLRGLASPVVFFNESLDSLILIGNILLLYNFHSSLTPSLILHALPPPPSLILHATPMHVCINRCNTETRGVNRAEISGPARKIFFGPARPAINVL